MFVDFHGNAVTPWSFTIRECCHRCLQKSMGNRNPYFEKWRDLGIQFHPGSWIAPRNYIQRPCSIMFDRRLPASLVLDLENVLAAPSSLYGSNNWGLLFRVKNSSQETACFPPPFKKFCFGKKNSLFSAEEASRCLYTD